MERLNDILGRTPQSRKKQQHEKKPEYKPKRQANVPSPTVSQSMVESIRLQTMPYSEYLETPEWQEKRSTMLRLAEYRCQVCNSPDMLQVHHRTYERRGREALADLTVLCQSCHDLFHAHKKLT